MLVRHLGIGPIRGEKFALLSDGTSRERPRWNGEFQLCFLGPCTKPEMLVAPIGRWARPGVFRYISEFHSSSRGSTTARVTVPAT